LARGEIESTVNWHIQVYVENGQ